MWMSQFFPSLDPTLFNGTENSLSMKGDVMRIVMEALRGHRDFEDALRSLDRKTPLPKLFNDMIQLPRTVQYIDAFLRTGRVDYRQTSVQKLQQLRSGFANHTFVQQWLLDDERHLALCSLFSPVDAR